MPITAKVYINSTIVIGICILVGCLLFEWQFTEPRRYFGYLLLACLASTLKIKLPKLRGTMSVNFLFILIGVAELTVAQTITLGCIAALIQCLWKPRTPPAVIQVLFNIAALVVSIAVSFSVSHALVEGTNLLVLLAVAVCAYFLLNTGMISLVLSLTGGKPFSEVWRQCYLWSFPYYLIGAAIAGAIVFSNRSVGWKPSLLMLPMMYLVYSYYRLYLLQITDQECATPVIFKS
jgi:hypothetical protein